MRRFEQLILIEFPHYYLMSKSSRGHKVEKTPSGRREKRTIYSPYNKEETAINGSKILVKIYIPKETKLVHDSERFEQNLRRCLRCTEQPSVHAAYIHIHTLYNLYSIHHKQVHQYVLYMYIYNKQARCCWDVNVGDPDHPMERLQDEFWVDFVISHSNAWQLFLSSALKSEKDRDIIFRVNSPGAAWRSFYVHGFCSLLCFGFV